MPPERFELPASWFVVAEMILWVLDFQPLSRPALTPNRQRSARKGIKRYVFSTVPSAGNQLGFFILGNEPLAYASNEGMTVAIKQSAHELIELLPDDATWQDLPYAVEFRADVEAGLADAKAGRLTRVEELRRDYGLRL